MYFALQIAVHRCSHADKNETNARRQFVSLRISLALAKIPHVSTEKFCAQLVQVRAKEEAAE